MCTYGDLFTVDHAMVCRRGGLIIQRHNEIRDLEAEMFRMVCTDVETEPVLQEITGEELNRAANKAYPLPSYDQPCCVSEEPGAREKQPIYLTLTLHRKVRKPEFK